MKNRINLPGFVGENSQRYVNRTFSVTKLGQSNESIQPAKTIGGRDMNMPGFTADAAVYNSRRRYRLSSSFWEPAKTVISETIRPQQQTCDGYLCPDGSGRPMAGEFPHCYCEEPPPPPRCETDEFTCPPPLVAYGKWPYCGCKNSEDPDPPPGGGGGGDSSGGGGGFSGMGGVHTCNQFFFCPDQMQMAEENGQCVCK